MHSSAIVFSIILGLSNVLIIYLMTSLDRASRAEQQIAMLNQSMQLQTNSYLALEKSYKAQRSATHEFKHQLQTVHGLLEQNNVEKAKEYIQQIQAAHTLRIFAANTGHAVIDAILGAVLYALTITHDTRSEKKKEKNTHAAQAELARRSAGKSPSKKNAPTGRSRYSSKYALSDRLYCGECGTRYQRCTWRNRDGSKRIVWRCVSRVDYGNKYCHDSPTLDEEPLHRAILAAINSTVKDRDNIVYNLKAAMEKELAPVAGRQLSLSEIDNQLEQLTTEFSKVLAEASESGDQAAYSDRFREIMQKQTVLKAQRDEIQRMLAESGKAAAHIEQCRQAAETTPLAITEWDEALIRQVVESVTVEVNNKLTIQFKNGIGVHASLSNVL